MRVVVDTNVLVSGLISAGGPCARILGLVVEGALQLCVDARILREYEIVLERPELRIDPEDVSQTLEVLRSRSEVLTPLPLNAGLPDEADRPFVEVATAAEAILVTGNTRHFPKRACQGVDVMTPRAFLERLGRFS